MLEALAESDEELVGEPDDDADDVSLEDEDDEEEDDEPDPLESVL